MPSFVGLCVVIALDFTVGFGRDQSGCAIDLGIWADFSINDRLAYDRSRHANRFTLAPKQAVDFEPAINGA